MNDIMYVTDVILMSYQQSRAVSDNVASVMKVIAVI